MFRTVARLATLLIPFSIIATAHADTGDFNRAFAGRIGDRYAFTMELESKHGKLTGRYRYVGKDTDIYLRGKIDLSGQFTMDERQGDDERPGPRTGTFTGRVSGQVLNGSWESAAGDRQLSVEAHQTAQVVIGSRRETFKQAVGSYVLDKMDGWCCASTLWDTTRNRQGHWVSRSSVLEGGARDTGSIPLKPDDLRKLDSMRVVVDPSLTTRLSIDGKVVLSIPYSEVGKPGPSDDDDGVSISPIDQSASATIDDSLLQLFRRRQIDAVRAMSGSYLAGDDADALEVDYDVFNHTFIVQTLTSSTWQGSSFYFKRQGS